MEQCFYWAWPQNSAPIPSSGHRIQVTTAVTRQNCWLRMSLKVPVMQARHHVGELALGNGHASDSPRCADRENRSDSAN